ncbi:MAG: glycosyltransferase family 2 protein [Acidobacteriota bacterium]
MNARPRVAVCLVTYNSADDLAECLEAVAAQDYRPLEVVIADCGSDDRSVEIARRVDLGTGLPKTVLPLGENRGFSGGMNACLVACRAPFTLALNADARPSGDFVSRLVERCLAAADVAAVTGRLTRPAAAGEPRRLDACGMYLTSTWRHLDRGSGELDAGQYSEPEEVFGATGAATLYRRSALDDVAFPAGEVFCELFHSYREDAELCFRFAERGWRVIYEPSAVAEHRRRVVPANRRRVPDSINRSSLKNRYLLRAYHQTLGNAWRTALPCLSRDVLALLYVLARERSSLGAYGFLWRHRREVLRRRRFLKERRTASVEAWFTRRSRPIGRANAVGGPRTDG